MLKKKLLFTAAALVVVLLGMFTYIILNCTSYDMFISDVKMEDLSDIQIIYSEPNIVEHSEPVFEDGYLKISFNSISEGTTYVEIHYYDHSNNILHGRSLDFEVGPFKILHTTTEFGNLPNIKGYPVYYVAAAVFFAIMAVYMIIQFRRYLKQDMYSYSTVFNCGLMILFIGLALFFAALSAYFILNYQEYQASSMSEVATFIVFIIIMVSIPVVLVFSVSMTISNISLIRHEGFRVANSLGIGISIAMILGNVFCLLLLPALRNLSNELFADINSSILGHYVSSSVFTFISSLYIFFEIYLLSTAICALIAAKHRPAYDKDYIIIHGCGIKEDGTLLPLLRGRADKAIEFYHNQLNATGKKAVFIPSGGQGSDEIISEGEAIKRYLLEQGIPAEQIMPETKSTNTLENMKFSKELIADSNAKVAFSTTNYHVFRCGILANQAGLKAEGMGSKTKWYFWPNAFIREFVGLIVSQKIKLIILAVIIALICAVAALLAP